MTSRKAVLIALLIFLTTPFPSTFPVEAFVSLDNLIITSEELTSAAYRLGEYKNSTGISTRVLTVEYIYENYDGVDGPERIRNCITDFHSELDVKYVTIFGDADQVPVRYVYVPDPRGRDALVPTDLYYADLNGTWDDNGDGIFADVKNDDIDGVPDLYIGRIPAGVELANASVEKIIGYSEGLNVSDAWFNRILLVSGDQSGDGSVRTLNGSRLNEHISQLVELEQVKLYHDQDLTKESLMSNLNLGYRFVNFAGHGKPGSWLLDSEESLRFECSEVGDLVNGHMLPVVTSVACSTARFDDGTSISERLVLEPGGGAIAYIGPTREAWTYAGNSICKGLMGEMNWRIYEAYGDGYETLGEIWGISVSRYVEAHGLGSMFNEKTVMEFALLGDPTLGVG